jgi:phosphatidylserine/phosphatidylglycerophosphate/cardiolipin synthase-like enzyme
MRYKLILLFLLVLFGCKKIVLTNNVVSQEIPVEDNKEIRIYFCPRYNCTKALFDFINSAKKSVHCALFDLDLNEILTLLAEKSKTIDVKLAVDNYEEIENIKSKKLRIKKNSDKQLSHNKFCIVDSNFISTGSFNPTKRGSYFNNDNFIIVHSKYLAKNYEDEFKELWNTEFGDGNKVRYPIVYLDNTKVENYFCPEDNCRQHVINIINNAKKSIYFLTFSFTDENIADALLFKDRNFDIKGVFEKMQAGSRYSQYKRLKEFGLNVKLDNNKYNMHHKVFIIDNETLITGSYNPSLAGNFKNDENILIIHNRDVAKLFLKEFEYVWG